MLKKLSNGKSPIFFLFKFVIALVHRKVRLGGVCENKNRLSKNKLIKKVWLKGWKSEKGCFIKIGVPVLFGLNMILTKFRWKPSFCFLSISIGIAFL